MARSVEGGQLANLTELQTQEAFQSVQVANVLAPQTHEAFQGPQVAKLPAPQKHEAFGGVHAAIPPASQTLGVFGVVFAVLAWPFRLVGSGSSRLQRCCPRTQSFLSLLVAEESQLQRYRPRYPRTSLCPSTSRCWGPL